MRGVFIAAGVALAVSILLTPYLIRFFSRQGFGQEIRADGPQSHQAKRGTPTMGGVAILLAIWLGYLVSHLLTGEPITASALLVLFLTTALGVVGFLDDFIKLRRARNLGLNKTSKIVGQVVTAHDLRHPRAALRQRRRASRPPRTASRSSATSRCCPSERSGSCCWPTS